MVEKISLRSVDENVNFVGFVRLKYHNQMATPTRWMQNGLVR